MKYAVVSDSHTNCDDALARFALSKGKYPINLMRDDENRNRVSLLVGDKYYSCIKNMHEHAQAINRGSVVYMVRKKNNHVYRGDVRSSATPLKRVGAPLDVYGSLEEGQSAAITHHAEGEFCSSEMHVTKMPKGGAHSRERWYWIETQFDVEWQDIGTLESMSTEAKSYLRGCGTIRPKTGPLP